MLLNSGNIGAALKNVIALKGLNVSKFAHNATKDLKLISLSGKSVWEADYFNVDAATGQKRDIAIRILIDAVSGEPTVRTY